MQNEATPAQKTCKQYSDHIWAHYYNFCRCSVCGKMEEIPAPSDYANDE